MTEKLTSVCEVDFMVFFGRFHRCLGMKDLFAHRFNLREVRRGRSLATLNLSIFCRSNDLCVQASAMEKLSVDFNRVYLLNFLLFGSASTEELRSD
ncbi:hypothetical protein Scep_027841 [Stephania cephalantha]|uniref:Uncharacterized protein n=1 Tax=Stephania cephalantha TaxID=152367 RepID=A0AAP0E8S3_9MAGN